MNIYRKVLQRIQAIWKGDIKDNKDDEKDLEGIQYKMVQYRKSVKLAGDDWEKFSIITSQIFIATWKEEHFITDEDTIEHKRLDTIMEKIFSKGEERIMMREIIEKYQAWIESALDGYDLMKDTWNNIKFRYIK
jgi:hypothetical protein